jgi:glyoxylase-like metal-dependent hydrolase (beta-lactamase superfamily II)
LYRFIEDNGLVPRYILNTHGHGDHVLGNRDMKAAFRVPICMHGADAAFFGNPSAPEELADKRLSHGDRLPLGECTISVIHTPGHTPGSVCYLSAGHLFTGDTLFVGDVGRTDLPGGSLNDLVASLEKHIISLPDGTVIWPGHDYGETPTSTIGREKRENPYITDFILEP